MAVYEQFSQGFRDDVEKVAFLAFAKKKELKLWRMNDEYRYPIINTEGKITNMSLSTHVWEDGDFIVTLHVGDRDTSAFRIEKYDSETGDVFFSLVA